jgi:hypothetical protein
MPEQGLCLRAELNNRFRDSKPLSEKIKEIAKGDDAITFFKENGEKQNPIMNVHLMTL